MPAETWTAKFQALKARSAGKQLDARQAQALLIAEVAAAWLDRMEEGDEMPPHAQAVADQLTEAVDKLGDDKEGTDRG